MESIYDKANKEKGYPDHTSACRPYPRVSQLEMINCQNRIHCKRIRTFFICRMQSGPLVLVFTTSALFFYNATLCKCWESISPVEFVYKRSHHIPSSISRGAPDTDSYIRLALSAAFLRDSYGRSMRWLAATSAVTCRSRSPVRSVPRE